MIACIGEIDFETHNVSSCRSFREQASRSVEGDGGSLELVEDGLDRGERLKGQCDPTQTCGGEELRAFSRTQDPQPVSIEFHEPRLTPLSSIH